LPLSKGIDIPKRLRVVIMILRKGDIPISIRGSTEISCREIRLLFFVSGIVVHQSHAPVPGFGFRLHLTL
jgi:hypothetical protein